MADLKGIEGSTEGCDGGGEGGSDSRHGLEMKTGTETVPGGGGGGCGRGLDVCVWVCVCGGYW